MANHKSALKRIRQNKKNHDRNRFWKSTMRTTIKRVREAVEAGDEGVAREALREATSMISRVASKGVIHKRTASRRVSRLASLVNKMGAAEA